MVFPVKGDRTIRKEENNLIVISISFRNHYFFEIKRNVYVNLGYKLPLYQISFTCVLSFLRNKHPNL